MAKKRRSPAPQRPAASATGDLSDRIAWWSLLTAVAAVPWVTSNLTLLRWVSPAFSSPITGDQSELPKAAFLFVAAACAVISWLIAAFRDGRELRWGLTGWLGLAYLAWMGVSAALGEDPSSSVFGVTARRSGLLTVGGAAALGFVAMQMATTPARRRALAAPLVISGAVMSAYGLMQVAGIEPVDWGAIGFEARRAFGTLGNPDLFASFLIAPLVLAPTLALTEKDGRRRIWWWVAAGVIAAGWVASFVRSAWIGGLIALVLLGLVAWRSRVRWERVDRTALLAICAAVVVAAVGAGALSQSLSITERLASLFRVEGSVDERLYIWDAAVAAIADRPVVGWGPSGFEYAWHRHRSAESNLYGFGAITSDAHNVVLGAAAETGVVGLALYLATLVTAVAAAERSRRTQDPVEGLPLAGWIVSAVAIVVTLLANVQSVALILTFWVALGVLAAATAKPIALGRPAMGAVAAVTAGLLLAGAVVAVRAVSADAHYASSGSETTTAEQSEAELKRAIALAPWEHTYRTALAARYTAGAREFVRQRGGFGALSDADRAQLAQGTAEAQTLFEQAISDVPGDYAAWAEYLEAAALLGKVGGPEGLAAVLPQIDEALARFPHALTLHVLKGRTLYELGRYEEALEVIEPVKDWDPSSPVAGIRYVMTLAKLGRVQEAAEAVGDLAVRFPGDQQIATLAAEIEALSAPGESTTGEQ